MKKFLVTGVSGFVGRYFLDYLEQQGIRSLVLGIDIHDDEYNPARVWVEKKFFSIDLLNRDDLENIIYSFQPEYVLHLASFSSVSYSWKNPVSSFQNNTNIFLNLVDSIRKLGLKTRILSIGSSEEYGNVSPNDSPLMENHLLNPVSPYGVARFAQEQLSKVYCEGYGLDVVMTRSFNHIGPGQKDLFVVSSFAKQIAEIKKSGRVGEIIVGDISIVRDFLDVRDVVSAYYGLLINGKKGEVYNVCSESGYSLEAIICELADISGVKVTTRVNPDFIRPNDNAVLIGSHTKIKREIGWKPRISIRQSLEDILKYWDDRV
jgi:GDP-4-dehydro-6-deoxy-D-mannose reductase